MPYKPVHIGTGAGFAGDRSDPAVTVVSDLIKREGHRFLIFETLAERTLALAQLDMLEGKDFGRLDEFFTPVLESCLRHNIRIISNIGSANPRSAGHRLLQIIVKAGLDIPHIGIVVGDDILQTHGEAFVRTLSTDTCIPKNRPILAANVYLGQDSIAAALSAGAQIVLTGRVADPALTLGPLCHCFNWKDNNLLAAGTVAGHLLECAGQVTGGYFMEPGWKAIERPAEIGFPIASVTADGSVTIGKPTNTGGAVTLATVKEQLLYEIHDPSAYLTPDVTLDLSAIRLQVTGINQVKISGAIGHAPPTTLKAIISWDAGWIGEGEISYAGKNAISRVALAIDLLNQRLARLQVDPCHYHIDVIGLNSMFSSHAHQALTDMLAKAEETEQCRDLRLRLAVRSEDKLHVTHALAEVEGLYTNGPAGGGGVRTRIDRRVATASAYIPRAEVQTHMELIS